MMKSTILLQPPLQPAGLGPGTGSRLSWRGCRGGSPLTGQEDLKGPASGQQGSVSQGQGS